MQMRTRIFEKRKDFMEGLNAYISPVDPDWRGRLKYINVQVESYQRKATFTKGTKETSCIDLLITENMASNNPIIKKDRYIIVDIKTGGDYLGALQMVKNQTNTVTGAQPISGSGKNAKYPQVNDPNREKFMDSEKYSMEEANKLIKQLFKAFPPF